MGRYLVVYGKEMRMFTAFLSVAFIIIFLHLAFHPVRVLGMNTSIFYMDERYTLASYFVTVVAFLTGYTALHEIRMNNGTNLRNFGYGLFFILLSLDEFFEIHEYANDVVKGMLSVDHPVGALARQSWIFPLSFVIGGIFILFIAKLLAMKPDAKKPFIIGMICFVLVLVFELIGGAIYGDPSYVYAVAIEEGMEMIGMSFFYLATHISVRQISEIQKTHAHAG